MLGAWSQLLGIVGRPRLAARSQGAYAALSETYGVAAAPGLDLIGKRVDSWRGKLSLRWVLTHMVEEYARHIGHADLLRERIDGAVGQ